MKNTNKQSGKIMLNSKRTFGRAFGIILPLCIFAVLLSAYIIYIANDAYAFIKPDYEIVIQFDGTKNLEELSLELEKSGVIENAYVFQIYAKYKKAETQVTSYSGDVKLNSLMSYREIILAFI